jgi:ligand-binding sensor domain-containing protein
MDKCCLLILSFFIFFQSFGQYEEENFKRFTNKEGLSNNYVTGIQQDANGFIWISTTRGLNRFDGLTFKQFLHTNRPNSLPGNSIFSIEVGDSNNLLVSTDDGLQALQTENLNTKNIDIPTQEALRYWSNACKFAITDAAGDYGVSTKTGFYIFSPQGKLKQRYDAFGVKNIGQSWMMFGNRLHRLADGNILQETSSNLLVYDVKTNKITEASNLYPGLTKLSITRRSTRDIFSFISVNKILLLNTANNSFDIIDIKTGETISFPSNMDLMREVGWQTKVIFLGDHTWAFNSKAKGFFLLGIDTVQNTVTCSQQKYMSRHLLTHILIDRDKRLWLGSDEGVFMQHSGDSLVKTLTIAAGKTKDAFAIHSLSFPGNRFIIGTSDGRVMEADKQTGKVKRSIHLDTNIPANPVASILAINTDTLWVAALTGLYWVDLNDFSFGKVKNIFTKVGTGPAMLFLSKEKIVWISTYDINLVYTYDLETRRVDSITNTNSPLFNVNTPTSFAEDRFGNIWIGGDEIARWNSRSKKIDTLITKIASQKNRKKGYTLMSDSNGEIWASVNDDGFAKITATEELHVRPENLVTDNAPSSFPMLVADRIFIPVINGIAVFNIHELRAIIFHTEDGFPQQPLSNYMFAYDSTDRSTWFASEKIVGKIPFAVYSSLSTAPKLLISELSVLNDSTINFPVGRISLRHNQNDVRIVLSGINYNDPGNMRFAYRFTNMGDTSWIQMGRQQNILLTNISPGSYQLEAKTYSEDNKWPEQIKNITIFIKPPFWKTSWFYLAVGLLTLALIYYLHRIRINSIRQKANLDKLLAQSEMKALHAQMNPHFIFNCLNSIREMVLNDENREASHYLSKFAQLIRMTLNQSSKQFISLKDTVDYLKRYLEMEQVRNHNFNYNIEIDERLATNEIMIPPMIIQPFLENAIWHGSQPGKELQLQVHFLKKNEQLICIVDDNGIGIETSLKNKNDIGNGSIGIINVKERIQMLNEKYDLNSSISVEDKSHLVPKNGTGTIVKLFFPVNALQSRWRN